MNPPIFAATMRDHGATITPRPLGTVRTSLLDFAPTVGVMATVARILASTCRRCEGDTFAPAACPPCVAEVERTRAEMRRELTDFIHADDGRDSGRWLA